MGRRTVVSKEYFDTQFDADGGGGGNPAGGFVELSTINYIATLLQQFVTMTIGSASAVRMNLFASLIEAFYLYASTNFYAQYSAITNAYEDYIATKFAGTGTYLTGYVNPAHLRLSAHFEGTGVIPNTIVSADSPIYNSNGGAVARMNVNTNGLFSDLSEVNQFTGGTPTSSQGTPEYAFDGDNTTSVGTTNPNYLRYDFGEGNEKVLKSFVLSWILSAGSSTTTSIQGSNNAVDWVTLTSTTLRPSTKTVTVLDSTNTTAYRYYQVVKNQTSYTLQVFEFIGLDYNASASYDTDVFALGTSAAKFTGNCYLSGVASATAGLQLRDLDWHYRGFIRFTNEPTSMCLFNIAGKQLEILATTTGLRVRYSVDGATFVDVDSDAISWTTNTFYFISVRRTNNTLYFYVNNVLKGSADLTGIVFYATATNLFYLGADSDKLNLFKGHMDEVEFWVAESTTDSVPVLPRSSAYIPEVAWESSSVYIPNTADSVQVALMLDTSFYSELGVPAVNTDVNLYISVDNGSIYQKVTLTKLSMLTVRTAIYTGAANLTDVVTTEQLVYKLEGKNNKPLKFDGIILYWF